MVETPSQVGGLLLICERAHHGLGDRTRNASTAPTEVVLEVFVYCARGVGWGPGETWRLVESRRGAAELRAAPASFQPGPIPACRGPSMSVAPF